MSKNYLFTAISASSLALMLAATSCVDSNESTSPENPAEGSAIRFAPTTEYSTKAGDITTNNLQSFQVFAYTGRATAPSVLMNNVTVNRGEDNVWTYSPLQYWPDVPVDFFAYSPAALIGNGISPMETGTYTNFPNTRDLVYAVSLDNVGKKYGDNPQVLLNFKHAMSKVTLNLSSSNKEIRVDISTVALANIKSEGKFIFPYKNTVPGSEDGGIGEWSSVEKSAIYLLHMSQKSEDHITLGETPVALDHTIFDEDGLYLIPQGLTWTSGGKGDDNYISMVLSVYDAATNEKIWPNDGTPQEDLMGNAGGDGVVRIALSTSAFSEWQAGRHYIYNIMVNSKPEPGAIEFGSPAVDTYVNVNSTFQ